MTEIVYTIKHTPKGEWMLDSENSSYGPFKTYAEALEGMHRLRVPETYTFDKNGDPT